MRVAHVVSSLEIGGAERLVVDLASAQRRAGLATCIVDLARSSGPLVEVATRDGVRVVAAGRKQSRLARTAMLAMRCARADVIHVHNPWALRGLLLLLPLLRRRVVYTRHGAGRYDAPVWRVLHRVARRFVHRTAFVTEDARRTFESVHGAWPGQVVDNGVAVSPTVPERSFAGRIRIGMVGRLVELKGHRLVIDAIAGLAPGVRARVELHVFGDGPDRAMLEAHAAAARVDVRFHGAVLDREQIYEALELLVIGSRTEGMSMALMEAMARAIPVIATNVGGNRVLVDHGATGLLVPSGNAGAMRDAIARLVDEPVLAMTMARASRAMIATRYSIDTTAARYRALYED